MESKILSNTAGQMPAVLVVLYWFYCIGYKKWLSQERATMNSVMDIYRL